MSLLTDFPSGYHKPEPINKSFDMIVRDWSRQQFGGDEIVDEIRKALNTGVTPTSGSYNVGGTYANNAWSGGTVGNYTAHGNGAIVPGTNYVAGETSALRLENLDNTMTSVLATAEHLKIFRFLHKEPSKQPFYQWNRRESYGSTRGFFGFTEGGLPTGGKGQWSRNGTYVKFLGTKGGVTHPAVLTNILGGMSVDPVAEDQLGRTMDFMQRIERQVMYGDEDIVDSTGTDSNYDGLVKLLTNQRSKNVIDLAGKPLTMDTLANIASRLVSEGKLLSFSDVTLFMSPQNIEDFGKLRYSTTLSSTNAVGGPGTTVDRADLTTSARTNLLAGLSIVGQATSFGVIPFEWSIFTEPVEGGDMLSVGDPNSPSAPGNTISAASDGYFATDVTQGIGACANATAKSNFDGTKGYFYRVSSVNDAGESTTVLLTPTTMTRQIPTSSQEVRLRFPRVSGSGLNAARAYRIYRAEKPVGEILGTGTTVISGTAGPPDTRVYNYIQGAAPAANAVDAQGNSVWKFVGYVADPAGPNSSQANVADGTYGPKGVFQNSPSETYVTFVDRNGTSELYNNFMPSTNIAPLICRNSADLCIAQMSPLLKMPLAPVSTTFEYLLLLYHTLVLKAPERQFIFKNVGKLN